MYGKWDRISVEIVAMTIFGRAHDSSGQFDNVGDTREKGFAHRRSVDKTYLAYVCKSSSELVHASFLKTFFPGKRQNIDYRSVLDRMHSSKT